MSKNKLKINNKEEWRYFFIGYLRLAEIVAGNVLRQYPLFKVSNQKKEVNEIKDDLKSLYIPTVFNIKHALEILIKHLRFELFESEYLQENEKHHDIESLFDEFEKNINLTDLRTTLEKFSIPGKELESFFNEGRDNISKYIESLKKIVEKYSHLNFIKDIIKENYYIKDSGNTAFKYPTNELSIQLDYLKILDDISFGKYKDLIEDVEELKDISFWLGFSIYSSNQDRKKKNDKK